MALIDNLVSYWSLDEASGNALDAHGSNPLTENGGTIASAAGRVGTARDLDSGSSQNFSHADNADLSTGDIDWTISGWVKAESFSSFPIAFGKWHGQANGSDGESEFSVLYHTIFDFMQLGVVTGTSVTSVASSFGALSTGTWYFIVAWHDSANNLIGISVNDVATTASYSAGVNNGNLPFRLGAGAFDSNFWDGLIDEVGFWKRVLTSQERTDLYNGGNGLGYPFTGSNLQITPAGVPTRLSGNTLTIQFDDADWIGDPPDFSVDLGTVSNPVVTSATTATLTYNAPSLANTATITDATTGATGVVEILAPVVVMEGNSLASGGEIFNQVVSDLTVEVDDYNVATATEKLDDMVGQIDAQVIPHFQEFAAKNIVVLFVAALNDMAAGTLLADIQADYIAYGEAIHAEGGLVLVTTHSDHTSIPYATRQALDNWIRSDWQTFADGLADIGADARLGADGASANTTYFNADGIHYVSGGNAAAAEVLTPKLQQMLTGSPIPVFMHHYRQQGIA